MAEIPCKRFWSCHSKILKTNIITPLWPLYYITQNPQNTISQTALKCCNQFRILITEALRWLQITTDAVNKLKVETTFKGRDQQLPDFITSYLLKIDWYRT